MTKITPPISCNLSNPQIRAQKSEYRRNLMPFLTETTYSSGKTRLTFSKPDVTQNMLERLIAMETECCSFLNFDLSETATHFHLEVSGPEGSQDIVRDFFSAPRTPVAQTAGCGCAKQSPKSKGAKYFAGFVTLCAIGCAIPPILIAGGLVSLTTGTYLGKGIETALILLAVMGAGFLLMRFLKKRRRGAL